MPANTTTMRFDSALWEHTVEAMGRDPIEVTVSLWEDRWGHPTRGVAPPSGTGMQLSFPIEHPYSAGDHHFGTSPRLHYRVTTTPVPAMRSAAVRRSSGDGGATRVTAPSASAAQTLVVELTNVRGLFKPRTGAGAPRSRHVDGYRSEDDRGRIFIDRTPTGRYRRNHQSIQLSARIHSPTGSPIPSSAQIQWTYTDPDDIFDTDPRVHRQWLRYLDEGDYRSGGHPRGQHGDDNEGVAPRWRARPRHSLVRESRNVAVTRVVGGESSIALHCPDIGGDSLIVKAEVINAPGTHIPAKTGIMTMWKHINVEYVRMPTAYRLPVNRVPPVFEDACVEMNFAPERVLQRSQDRATMADQPEEREQRASEFIVRNFQNCRNGGWFFLCAANLPYPSNSRRQPPYGGRRRVWDPNEIGHPGLFALDVEGALQFGPENNRNFVSLAAFWPRGIARGHFFGIQSAGTPHAPPTDHPSRSGTSPPAQITTLWVFSHDLQRRFTGRGSDGSNSHAYNHRDWYAPRSRIANNGTIGAGYGAPGNYEVQLFAPGGPGTSGHSPRSRGYFAGRTVVYTKHPSFTDRRTGQLTNEGRDSLVWTIAHELTHGFGMPHRCGFFDVRSPRAAVNGANTCIMNYNYVWMCDGNGDLIEGTEDRIGLMMCGRHIKEVRRIKLADNRELRRRGW